MKKLLVMMIVLAVSTAVEAHERQNARKSTATPEQTTADNTRRTFEFTASSDMESTNGITDQEAGTHFLGSEIARKMYLCTQRYSYKEPVAPGNSATKTILRKPEIYSSVKKIERYLKKNLKDGLISESAAEAQYNRILNVVLNIYDVDTARFEARIKSVSNPDELIEIYLNEVSLQYVN